jgi:uncharacterized protein YegL
MIIFCLEKGMKFKRIGLMLGAFALTAAINAQKKITVNFEGRNASDNTVVTLDSVRVYNITQNSDITITGTSIQIQGNNPDDPGDETGINYWDSGNASFSVSDAYPNPAIGTSSIDVCLDRQLTLTLSLYSMEGKNIACFSGNYGAGRHVFQLSTAKAGIYLLQITDGKNRLTKKLVYDSNGYSERDHIRYAGMSALNPEKAPAKVTKSNEIGDQFMFVGYANGFSCTVYASPVSNTTITFVFTFNHEQEQPNYTLQRHEVSVGMPSFVDILFTVTDQNGRGVDDLTNADFIVKENGSSVSPTETSLYIRKMNTVPYVIQTVLMLDNSRSLTPENLEQIKQSAKQLIRNKDEHQEFAIYCFSEDATLLRDFTSDTALLVNTISGITRSGYSTNLYGSYITGVNKINNSFSKELVKLGYLVFFTDGDDTQGSATLAQAIAARGDKRVYMIGLGNELDSHSLNQLANPPPYFSITDPAQLTAVFNQIQEDVITYARSFYWLNYMSPKRNTTATLRLEIINNTNTTATGYIEEGFDATDFEAAEEGVYVNAYKDFYDKYGIISPRYTLGGQETFVLEAVTYHATDVPHYTWSVSNNMATVTPDPTTFNRATLTIPDFDRIGGEIIVTVTDETNGFTQTVRAWRGTYIKLIAGTPGEIGNVDGAGIDALFSGYLNEIEFAPNGSLYAVDSRNKRIVKINTATTAVTTFATIPTNLYDSSSPIAFAFDLHGLAIDGSNNLYTSMYAYNDEYIFKITPSGVVSMWCDNAYHGYMDWGSDNKLYISVSGWIDRIGSNCWRETVAGSNSYGYADGTGNAAQFTIYTGGIARDNFNNMYVVDDYRIRKVTPTGVVTTLAGSGSWGTVDGTGAEASFHSIYDLVVGNDGNIYVSDMRNIRKVTPAGVVTTPVNNTNAVYSDSSYASGNAFEGIEIDNEGNFYVTDGSCIYKIIMGKL